MKKGFFVSVILCIMLMITGCGATPVSTTESQTTQLQDLISLNIAKDTYSLEDELVPYIIENTTGKMIDVVLVPILEMETADGWKNILPTDIGFCGTPTGIEDSLWEDNLALEWYKGQLVPGQYRLSLEIHNQEDPEKSFLISDTFELK